MKTYIGLDVHSKHTSYCCQNENGDCIAKGRVKTSALGFSFLLKDCGGDPDQTYVGLETGGQAEWTYSVLLQMGVHPVVIDAREVHDKSRRKRQKTDERDAFEICDGLRRDIYVKTIWIPTPQIRWLRDVLTQRRAHVRTRVRMVNAAKGLLRSKGLSAGKLDLRHCPNSWKTLLKLNADQDFTRLLELQFRSWLVAHEIVLEYDKMVKDAIAPFKEAFELLQTAPGVGPIIAAEFIAAVGDPSRFPSARHVVSYLGLAPSSYDSGERKRGGGITKEGPSHVRAVICQGAHQARVSKNPLNPYYRKLFSSKGVKRAVIAVTARMARILYQMWKKMEAFDEKKLNVVRDPFTVKKSYTFRLAK
jgi:transposase